MFDKTIGFGAREAMYAALTEDGYDSPRHIPGMRDVKASVEQSTDKTYADDIKYSTNVGTKDRSLEVTVLQVPADYAAAHLGFKKVGEALVDTGNNAPHAFQWLTREKDAEVGKERDVLHIIYSVTMTDPGVDNKTKEEKVEAAEYKLTGECAPSSRAIDPDGEYVTYLEVPCTEDNKETFKRHTEEILLPKDFAQEGSDPFPDPDPVDED